MEFTGFEKKAEEALSDCKGAVKHCALNALHHLKKAWDIKEIDPAMAVFRGITAEEEAASSVFYTLKNQRYQNAKKIRFKEHTYKQALFPYIKSIVRFLGELNQHNGTPIETYHLQHTEHNKRKAMCLHLKLKQMDMVATPTPPLHFNISNPDTGKVIIFEDEFKRTNIGDTFDSVLDYVKHIADQRNNVLYANAGGRPVVKGDMSGYLSEQKKKIFTMIYLVLLVDPWIDEGHSAFVQQALDGFLLLLEQIDENDVCPPVDRNAQG